MGRVDGTSGHKRGKSRVEAFLGEPPTIKARLGLARVPIPQSKKIDVANQKRDREQYRKACNAMFQRENEANVIRPLAEEMSSTEFPVDDSANSRYTTLFAAHAEFDTLRCSFLEYSGRHSMRRLTRSLAIIAQRLDPSSLASRVFEEWVSSYKLLSQNLYEEPERFTEQAWQTYRHTICSPHYYFSASEMLLFARLLELPLVVTVHNGDVFNIIGHTVSGALVQDVVYISLADNGEAPVRGHFERIWPAFEFQQCFEAYEVEERYKAEQLRREEGERQRMKTEDRNVVAPREDANSVEKAL